MKHFFSLILLTGTLFANNSSEINTIDEQIEELKKMKEFHQGRADWYENQGDRMQFNDELDLEARQSYQREAVEEDKVKEIDQAILELEQQKSQLLQSGK